MTPTPCFATNFYSFKDLFALSKATDPKRLSPLFSKLDKGKIVAGELRLVPLLQKKYAVYHKEFCLFDDEARIEAFAYKKYIKIAYLFDPLLGCEEFLKLESKITSQVHIDDSLKLLSFHWYYHAQDQELIERAIKIHALANHFFLIFPDICPQISDLQVIEKDEKTMIRYFETKLPPSRVLQEITYEIQTYEKFQDHLVSLYNLVKHLFDNDLAHGDLACCNLLLNKEGQIKTLIDFDTAATCSFLPMRYQKMWIEDLVKITEAMIFYQISFDINDWKPEVNLPKEGLEKFKIQLVCNQLELIYENLLLVQEDMKFNLDHRAVSKEDLEVFRNKTNPRYVFGSLWDE